MPSEFDLLCDQSLSDAARVIGLRICAMGDDWHELAPDDFAKMCAGYPKHETIAKHLRALEISGYIVRKSGGRGHSDSFRFAFSSEQKSGSKTFRSGVLSIRPENSPDLNAVVVVEGVVEETPIVPLPVLSAEAEAAIEKNDAKLAGCRDSLRDYLTSRVPPDRQKAYVYTIVAWLDDSDPSVWRKPTGGWLGKEFRTAVLATALNELGAANEKMRKYEAGDPVNLKTKINILIKQRESDGNGRERNHSRTAGGESRAATGTDNQSARRRRTFSDSD